MLPNRESGPQNQPRAKVAVSVMAGATASIGGILLLDISLLSPILEFEPGGMVQPVIRNATKPINTTGKYIFILHIFPPIQPVV